MDRELSAGAFIIGKITKNTEHLGVEEINEQIVGSITGPHDKKESGLFLFPADTKTK